MSNNEKQTVMNSIYNTIASILNSNTTSEEKISALYTEQAKHAATKHISDRAWFAYLRAIKSLQA
jgi:hypothetical protein